MILLITGSVIFTSCKKSGSKADLKTGIDSVSYSWGVNVGQYLKGQGYQSINGDAFMAAINDVLASKDLAVSGDKAREVISKYSMEVRKQLLEKNKKISSDFLAANKKKAGVITLPDGLQYEVTTQGSGPVPKANDNVTVNYHGTLIDGTIFDSSIERKQPFKLQAGAKKVIPAWDEALLMMPVGSKWKLYVPPELGYGANPRPGGKIEPNQVLIFDLELISIDPPTPPDQNQQQGAPQASPQQQGQSKMQVRPATAQPEHGKTQPKPVKK
ncbi:MAG: FKBP-type peptidyl-prolyl cis-trans isomerase [Bacteroidia bacterium]|nr:FKBP-type peptidyl-prolyl cis-trans isomerase [Bacteroidia bacterium]